MPVANTGAVGTPTVNNQWTTASNVQTTVPGWSSNGPTTAATTQQFGYGTGDVFGSNTVPTVSVPVIDKNLDVTALKNIISQAVTIYDSGLYNKKEVATEVDILRTKLRSKSFDASDSDELRNIFGYIVGDMFNTLLDNNRAREYDEIMDMILELFPEGSGNPVVSKYAGSSGSGSKKKFNNKKSFRYDKLVNEIIDFEKRNGINPAEDKIKFDQIFAQFKKTYPERKELNEISGQCAFNAYARTLGITI